MQTSEVNRWIYQHLGNRGYRLILKRHKEDAREWLHRTYRPRWWNSLVYTLFVRRHTKPFLHVHEGCDCTWCKCLGHTT